MNIDKRQLLEARLKLGTLTTKDYVTQLEIRDEMVNRLHVKLKEAVGALEHYSGAEDESVARVAKDALEKIFDK